MLIGPGEPINFARRGGGETMEEFEGVGVPPPQRCSLGEPGQLKNLLNEAIALDSRFLCPPLG